MARLWVINASPLIAFHKVGLLDTLTALAADLVIPEAGGRALRPAPGRVRLSGQRGRGATCASVGRRGRALSRPAYDRSMLPLDCRARVGSG